MAFKKIPKRYTGILIPFFLSLFMSGIITAISILRANGFNAEFFHLWPSTWAISWAIGFPVVLCVLPVVRKLVSFMVEA
jgi:hypothetical protein